MICRELGVRAVASPEANAAVGEEQTTSTLGDDGDGGSTVSSQVGGHEAGQPGADNYKIIHERSTPSRSW